MAEEQPPWWQNLKLIRTTALYFVFGMFFVVGILKWMGNDSGMTTAVQIIGVACVVFASLYWYALKADHDRKESNRRNRRR